MSSIKFASRDYRWPVGSQFKEVCWDVGQLNPKRAIHTGLDIYASKDTPVYAITDGRVINNNTGSNIVVDKKFLLVDHGGLYAYYGHISSPLRANDRVTAGQQLGSVVAYTPVSQTHLHLSLSNSFNGGVDWGYRSTLNAVLADFENVRPYFGNLELKRRCF
jgi:murein DD-endopeptidase MepM/ murein hydrolase activator NlpD